jgi:hypothetical protein
MSSNNTNTIDPFQTKKPEQKEKTHQLIQDEDWLRQMGMRDGLINPEVIKPQQSASASEPVLSQAPIGDKEVAMMRTPVRNAPKVDVPTHTPSKFSPFDLDMIGMSNVVPKSEAQSPQALKKGQIAPPSNKAKDIQPLTFDMGLLGSLKDQASHVTQIFTDVPAQIVNDKSTENQQERIAETRRKIAEEVPKVAQIRRQSHSVMQTAERVRTDNNKQEFRTFREKFGAVVAKLLKHRIHNEEEASGRNKNFVRHVIDFREEQLANAMGTVKLPGSPGKNREHQNIQNSKSERPHGRANSGAG